MREREREKAIEIQERINIDNPEFQVLRGIKDTDGTNPIRPLIANFLLNGGRLVVAGEAGSGKTTIAHQFLVAIKRNAELLGINLSTSTVSFDKVYTDLERIYGNRYTWGEDAWKKLNNELVKRADAGHRVDKEGNKVHFQIIELPGCGATPDDPPVYPGVPNIEDRGKKALKEFAKDARGESDRRINTKIFLTIPDPAVQKFAALIRAEITQEEENEAILEKLKARGIMIEGLTNTAMSEQYRKKLGKKIKGIFRKMAKDEHIKKVKFQESFLRASYEIGNRTDYLNRVSRIKNSLSFDPRSLVFVFEIFDLPFALERAASEEENFMNQATFSEWRVREELELGKGKGFCIHNPFRTENVILPRSTFGL